VSQTKWDRKTMNFVKVGADNIKLVKTKSGIELPEMFKEGRFENWKKSQEIKIPNVGEQEIQHTNVFNHLHWKFRQQSSVDNWPTHDNHDGHGKRNSGRSNEN